MNEKPERLQYSIEEWTVNPDQNLISSRTEQTTVEPKTMSVLVFLIEKQGQTISREEFIHEVWGGAIVTDNSLNQSISKLRKIFNDETAKPRIIETVSKRGYRLIAPVQKIDNEPHSKKEPGNSKPSYKTSSIILLTLLTVSVIIWTYFRSVPEKKEYPSSIFSAVDGMERHPSFSKNADRVVYVFGNVCNDESEIRIQSLGSDEVHRFAKFPGFKKFPRFSSDNKEVIFWNETDNSSKSILYLATPPDTGLTKLLEIPSSIRGLDWSDDKKLIVYSARDPQGSYCIFLWNRENRLVFQITHPPQPTVNDRFPVFSRDGKSVVFIRATSEFDSDIWSVNIETKNVTRLTLDNLNIRGLACDENGLYYSRLTEEDGFELVRIDEPMRDAHVMITSDDELSALDARNNKIIFQTNTTAVSISGYNLATKHGSILFNSNFQEIFPEFSPGGDRFAFISNRTGPFLLWVGDVTGTHLKKVSSFKLSNVSNQPRWSPDESYILVDAVENGEPGIYRIDLIDGKATRILKNASYPVFSSDGRFLYFNSRQSGASQIWKIPTEGGEAVQITYEGGLIGFESEADTSFYFMKETEDGVWQKKGTSEQLAIKDIGATEIKNWRMNGQKIYYSKRFNGIWCYDLKTKVSNQVLTIDAGTCKIVSGLSVSPDGQSFLFSSDERLESDLRIIEY